MGMQKPMRESMPEIAAWIDDLRAVFGTDAIERIIRASVRDGVPGFYGYENGLEVGVRPDVSDNVWRCEGLEDRYVDGTPSGQSDELRTRRSADVTISRDANFR
jgi:hypothetical protein